MNRTDVEAIIADFGLSPVTDAVGLARVLTRHTTFVGVETSCCSVGVEEAWTMLTGEPRLTPQSAPGGELPLSVMDVLGAWMHRDGAAVSRITLARHLPERAIYEWHLTYGFTLFGTTGLSAHALARMASLFPSMGLSFVSHNAMAAWKATKTGPFIPTKRTPPPKRPRTADVAIGGNGAI